MPSPEPVAEQGPEAKTDTMSVLKELSDTVGRNEKTIKEYVRNQLQEDIASDQMCLKEFTDPFTGKPVAKGK